jgi:hypothetical protein
LQPVLYIFDPHLPGIAVEVQLFTSRIALMIDEVTLEELRSRAGFEKMDEAFCAALLNAIEAGQEAAPTGVCTAPGTRWPTSCLGRDAGPVPRSADSVAFRRAAV